MSQEKSQELSIEPNEFRDTAWLAVKSGFVSAATVLAGQPADVIKVLVQNGNLNITEALKATHGRGAVAFFEGTAPNMVRRFTSSLWRTPLMTEVPPIVQKTFFGQNDGNISLKSNLISAFIIAGPDTFFSNFLEFSKVQKQTGAGKYKDIFNNLKNTEFSPSGLKNTVFRGYLPTYGKSAFGWTTFLLNYEVAKEINKSLTGEEKMSPIAITAASASDAVTKVLFTNPFDVVKTRMQAANSEGHGFFKTTEQLYMKNGWKVFFRGASPRLFHAAMSAAVGMFFMEESKSKEEKKEKAESFVEKVVKGDDGKTR